MALRPVSRRSVPDEVFDQLARDIVRGELAPGQPLPAERRLAEVLGVSRPAVREALQRLSHAGLVTVRQGGATTVRDHRESSGLDLLPQLLAATDEPDPAVLRSLLEVRAAIGPDVARRCAQRRDDGVVDDLHAALDRLADVTGDPPAAQPVVQAWWRRLVDGTDNVVYRLLCNSLEAAAEPLRPQLLELLADELVDVAGYRAVVEAVERRDGARAAAATRRLLEAGTAAALQALGAPSS